MDQGDKWNQCYSVKDEAGEPTIVLSEFAHLLPAKGVALDLACGLGANALFLAQRGLDVQAWDASQVALEKLQASIENKQLSIKTQQRDCEQYPPEPGSLDVLVVSNFLYRPIMKQLAESLRPGGLLYYETHTLERPDHITGPSNPDYLLRPGELLEVFNELDVHAYREEGLAGDLQKGRRGRAYIVASRPLI